MSWDQVTPTMNASEMVTKVQGLIIEQMENHRQISVSDLGEFNEEVINFWVEELFKLGFKILRNAKAAALLGEGSKVDKTHIEIAIRKITKFIKPPFHY